MKYQYIKEKLEDLKIFSLEDIYLVDPDFRQPTLYEWESQGKVKKIRNKWYVFPDFTPENTAYYLIANRIYFPSYISLELALNHYGVIPETVLQYTSVTTNKTNSFETALGQFVYKTVSERLFWGYKVISNDKNSVNIASLEKTILDTLYLNTAIKSEDDFNELRYNKMILKEQLNLVALEKYLKIFQNNRLEKTVELLFKYINQ